MWDLPRPGLEPVSPALAGRFSTTAPPGKSRIPDFFSGKIRGSGNITLLATVGWRGCVPRGSPMSIPCLVCDPRPALGCLTVLLLIWSQLSQKRGSDNADSCVQAAWDWVSLGAPAPAQGSLPLRLAASEDSRVEYLSSRASQESRRSQT